MRENAQKEREAYAKGEAWFSRADPVIEDKLRKEAREFISPYRPFTADVLANSNFNLAPLAEKFQGWLSASINEMAQRSYDSVELQAQFVLGAAKAMKEFGYNLLEKTNALELTKYDQVLFELVE